MISTNDMRPGQAILFEGRICLIVEYERIKPGKGPTFVRVKLKDINTGQSLDKTWRGEQKVELAILEPRPHQFLYRQGEKYHFMDTATYDQVELGPEQVPKEIARFLKENMEVQVTFHNGKAIKVEIPAFVTLKVDLDLAGPARGHGERREQAGHGGDRGGDPGAALRERRGRAEGGHADRHVRHEGLAAADPGFWRRQERLWTFKTS